MAIERKMAIKSVEEIPTTKVVDKVVEEIEAPKVAEAPPLPPQPKRYICKTTCWVSHRCQMYNPGDIVVFQPGEYVPDHFTLIE